MPKMRMDNVDLDLSLFDYALPENQIAQEPLADRAASRMLVLYRNEQRWEDRQFRDFPSFLRPDDCLVLNDSRVFPSRLLGKRGAAEVEVFLIEPVGSDGKLWKALVRPGKKMGVGERIQFGDVEAEVMARGPFGERTVRFLNRDIYHWDIYRWLEEAGHMPLPPYIKRADGDQDRERYQTVFARQTGSVAAPTAGLHFTPEILGQCPSDIAYVTLHVGLGTFQPVRGETLHSERFSVPEESALKIRSASRVFCAGTTCVRSVESFYLGQTAATALFIRPGFQFQRVDAMLTNFHLPQSSLLMLVCAFAGREFVLEAYRHAVAAQYRFFSYGDCMLLL